MNGKHAKGLLIFLYTVNFCAFTNCKVMIISGITKALRGFLLKIAKIYCSEDSKLFILKICDEKEFFNHFYEV